MALHALVRQTTRAKPKLALQWWRDARRAYPRFSPQPSSRWTKVDSLDSPEAKSAAPARDEISGMFKCVNCEAQRRLLVQYYSVVEYMYKLYVSPKIYHFDANYQLATLSTTKVSYFDVMLGTTCTCTGRAWGPRRARPARLCGIADRESNARATARRV